MMSSSVKRATEDQVGLSKHPKKQKGESTTTSASSASSQQQGSSSELASSCPYAQAMTESTSFNSLPGIIEMKSCPAFSNSCPFKSAGSAEEVQEQLKRIPLGHLKQSGAFFETLKYFHSTTGGSSGSCPVKNSVELPPEWSFHEAMEEFSLLSVVAKLALAQETKDTPTMRRTSSLNSLTQEFLPKEEKSSPTNGPSLSEALKKGTAVAHAEAESVHFVKNFIRGKIDRDLYGLLVAQLYHLYGKLEEALDQHAPGHFGVCHFPELYRYESLCEDVNFWHTTSKPEMSPAVRDYVERIEYLCQTNPLLLLAHAYTRYLGDLSGGKILARVAKRALNLTSQDDGLSFYHFPKIESFKLFKDKYRNALNNLNLTEEQIQAVVREANIAFLLNMRLFEELDVIAAIEGSSIRPLDQVYEHELAPTTTDKKKNSEHDPAAECPFMYSKKAEVKKEGKCPWPFVVFHDPVSFFQAWQTWALMGVLLTYLYHSVIAAQSN